MKDPGNEVDAMNVAERHARPFLVANSSIILPSLFTACRTRQSFPLLIPQPTVTHRTMAISRIKRDLLINATINTYKK